VVVASSADYSFVGHQLGLAGLVIFTALIWFLPHSQNLFWEFSAVFLAQGAGWVIGWSAGQLPSVVRFFAGQKRLAAEVHESALASFLHNNLHHTVGRTGILVYISHLEHRVEIVADEGIHACAGQDFWVKETAQIAAGLAGKNAGPVLAQTIREIGAKLAEHFPIQPGDKNELPDHIRDR
jgi:putative membrane protein